MTSPPVHHIDVRAFRYGTEVPERVERALTVIYPPLGEPDEPDLDRATTVGHYGHEIEVYEFALTRTAEFETVFDQLQARGNLEAIAEQLDDRVTEACDLYLRFDKQLAYSERRLALGGGIELRIRLEAYPAKRDAAIENARAYLDELIGGRDDG